VAYLLRLYFATMQLFLKKVYPVYIEPEKIAGSQIWNSDILFLKGEKTQIVAPSGSGKTSLIHFLYGLRKEYKGEIAYDNKNISAFSNEDFATWRQNKISIIFQDLRLFNEHTVRQNLDIKRLLSPFHTENKIEQFAVRLGIKNKLDKQVKTCSYG
jgi:putative ABC transport system ATP-binding protein